MGIRMARVGISIKGALRRMFNLVLTRRAEMWQAKPPVADRQL
jgi:hypothetical protein